MTKSRIGFIGLGNMGGRMSNCVVRGGRSVLGYDTNASVIAEANADPAESVADVVTGSDVVLLSLPESRVVEAVILGVGGLLEHARSGQVIVDLSTAAPESTRRIHALLA